MSVVAAARFLRLPNAFTAAADAVAGAALAATASGRAFEVSREVFFASVSAFFLYAFGVGLNDWADRERDRLTAPDRPLVTGAISPRVALLCLFSTALAALVFAAFLGGSTILVAVGVVIAVYFYDVTLKERDIPSALSLGVARAGAFLLGAAADLWPNLRDLRWTESMRLPLCAAAGYGIVVAALTYLSQKEDLSGDDPHVRRRVAILGLGYLLFGVLGPRPVVFLPTMIGVFAYVVTPIFSAPKKVGPSIGRAVFSFPIATAALSALAHQWEAAAIGFALFLSARGSAKVLKQIGA